MPTVYYRTEKAPAAGEMPITAKTNDDPPELPTDWDPNTDPYPEATFAVVIDQAMASLEADANNAIAQTEWLLDDPYSDDMPEEEYSLQDAAINTGTTPMGYRFVRAVFSINNHCSDDPCIDQRENVEVALVALGAATLIGLSWVAAIPLAATAATVALTIGEATVGFSAATYALGVRNGQFARCKSRNTTHYPRRP